MPPVPLLRPRPLPTPRIRSNHPSVAIAALWIAVALFTGACATDSLSPAGLPAPGPSELHTAIEDGIRLYDAGEYALAGGRFREASGLAESFGERELAFQAVTAACTSWLLARRLPEFDDCTETLAFLQRRTHRTTPGTNALVALGAYAGQRPVPPVRVPPEVRGVVSQNRGER